MSNLKTPPSSVPDSPQALVESLARLLAEAVRRGTVATGCNVMLSEQGGAVVANAWADGRALASTRLPVGN